MKYGLMALAASLALLCTPIGASAAVANWDCAYDAMTADDRVEVGEYINDDTLDLLALTAAGKRWDSATRVCETKHNWNKDDALAAASHVVARLSYDSAAAALREMKALDDVVAAYASMAPKVKAATLADNKDEDANEIATDHMLDQDYDFTGDEDFFFDQLGAWYNARTALDAETLPKAR